DDVALLSGWARWQMSPQESYASLLHQYAGRQASLGALSFHRDKQGNLGVSLSEVGRFLYGLQDRWTLTSSARPVAVVGGDFAVTLLEPAPDFLLELRGFAEPVTSGGAGSVLRISLRLADVAALK